MREIKESDLKFTFSEQMTAIKFDDTKFYREAYNKLPGGKGVDIIADSDEMLQLIEVKNCSGRDVENNWRIHTNNSKISSAPAGLDVEERDSLDIEVAKKVASTIACLYGAWSKAPQSGAARELADVWRGASADAVQTSEKPILIVLFLEGNFDNPKSKTRSKKMIMKRLQDSLKAKLSWLNCRVSVVDSATYNAKCFSVSK